MVEPHSKEKLKKPLFYTLAAASASFAFLVPVLASAGFSLGSLIMGAMQPAASSSSLNSQTIPLLAPAVNIDPKPPVGGGDIALVGGSALMAQEGPSGTPADLAERPSSTAISVYVVHPGDTLSGIAQMFDVSVNTIKWANDLPNGTIHEGQTLVILPITGVRYTVQKGDTLASIAKKYNAHLGEVAQYNELAQNASLAAGSIVIIPDGELAAPAVAKSSSSSSKSSSSGSSAALSAAGGPTLSGYYAWPVDGGIRTQGLHGYNGVDIGAPSGTAIFAAADGKVIIANASGGWNGGYGNYVVIQHANGTQTLYAHMSRVLTSVGASVGKGEKIGLVGMTGKATGNHLHFEVRGATNPFAK